MRHFFQPVLAFVLAGFVCVGFLAHIAIAAQEADSQPQGLSIGPPRSEVALDPGTSTEIPLIVTNKTDAELAVALSSESFSVVNENYDYDFSDEVNTGDYIQFAQPSIVLAANATVTVQVRVSVPLGAEPGGRYFSLFANNDIRTDGGAVVRQRVASLVYLTVNGDVSRLGNVVSLRSPLLLGNNTTWSASLQNKGTTHFRSRYDVTLRTLWGSEVSKSSGSALILPGSVRLVSGDITAPQLPGIYRAEYTIGLGDTPQKKFTRLAVYLPLWTAILLFLLLLLAVAARVRYSAQKKRNKRD